MQLGPDVYMALVDGDLVFLDGRRDGYSCITRAEAPAVLAALTGSAARTETPEVVQELREAGLLIDGPPAGFHPAVPDPVVGDFRDLADTKLPVTPATLLRLAAAVVEGAARSRARPSRWLSLPRRERNAASSRAATLALQFDRLRPLIPRSGRCLPNSLMLLAYLRRHGISAQIVVAVRSFPFEAHCWVQHNGVVLNDTVEHVSWYVPIAVA
jgi:hypothetical protein